MYKGREMILFWVISVAIGLFLLIALIKCKHPNGVPSGLLSIYGIIFLGIMLPLLGAAVDLLLAVVVWLDCFNSNREGCILN